MTAAAAIRWLNGEDFSLLPSKTTQDDLLTRQVEAVVQEVRIQNKQQEKLLQRLDLERTNQCVDLLRADEVEKLARIQVELVALRQALLESTYGENWDARLSETLDNLQNCMERISSRKNSAVLPDSSKLITSLRDDSSPEDPPVLRSSDKSQQDEVMEHTSRTLEEAVRTLVQQNSSDELRAGAQLLYLYVSNLSKHPTAPRYRKIFTTNDSFQKVDRLVGGKEFLISIGFVETGTYLEWKPETAEDRQIMELLNCALSALKIVKTVPSVVEPEFVERAVAAAAALPTRHQSEAHDSLTCPPTPMHQMAGFPCDTELQTPEIGVIASPPNTRKHDSEKPEFPLLHSTDEMPYQSPVLNSTTKTCESNQDSSNTTESLSPISGADGGTGMDATEILWK